ncbi:MAG: pesticidal protein Cry7Aa [Bacteroidetes bacterium]|nr:MAG: pesticidal protein Cry7Aa [Bacteroidota bacterium]
MIEVKKEGILLKKTTLPFENEGVLNPAVIREGDYVHVFYRAVSAGNYSSIGYCKLSGPLNVISRNDRPVMYPQFDYESHGMEDPRIVKIEGTYYITYTAYDGVNALGAMATSTDLKHFERQGIVVPQITYEEFSKLARTHNVLNEKYLRYNEHERVYENKGKKVFVWDKNLMLFPRKIDGKFYFLHRIKPDIQILASVDSLDELTDEFWNNFFLHFKEHIILEPRYDHEVSYIGGGCPPIETEHGWLLIYHGVHDTVKGYVYSACAALLDLHNPHKEIARLPYALFKPEREWELKGEVNNVCFPTGAALFDDTLYIYYGAADERIACASVSLSALLAELLLNPTEYAH